MDPLEHEHVPSHSWSRSWVVFLSKSSRASLECQPRWTARRRLCSYSTTRPLPRDRRSKPCLPIGMSRGSAGRVLADMRVSRSRRLIYVQVAICTGAASTSHGMALALTQSFGYSMWRRSVLACVGSDAAGDRISTPLWYADNTTPLLHKVGHLLCKLKSRSGLALGPLGAPEYESRVNSSSRVPSDHHSGWSDLLTDVYVASRYVVIYKEAFFGNSAGASRHGREHGSGPFPNADLNSTHRAPRASPAVRSNSRWRPSARIAATTTTPSTKPTSPTYALQNKNGSGMGSPIRRWRGICSIREHCSKRSQRLEGSCGGGGRWQW